MVKKQYLKSTIRLFLKHYVQLINIAAIFLVSVGLMSGLGVMKYNVNAQINDSYQTNNVHDLRIIGDASSIELVYNQLELSKDELHIKDMEYSYSMDYADKDGVSAKRVATMDFTGYESKTNAIDKLRLVEGRFPNKGECVVLEKTNEIKDHKINETIEIDDKGKKATIVGIVHNPTVISKESEPSVLPRADGSGLRSLNDGIYYCDTPESKTAIMVTLDDSIRSTFNAMSNAYFNKVDVIKNEIESFFIGVSGCFTLNECRSFAYLSGLANKLSVLSLMMVVFFTLITLLVVYSTMSRFIDEDRKSVAVLKTIGYSNASIVFRYVVFIFISGIVGILLSSVPSYLVSKLIINSLILGFNISSIIAPAFNYVFLICAGFNLIVSLVFTLILGFKTANSMPIKLLTPKVPKVGKKIFLERIKRIWNKLSFKYKSTMRNIFLFKSRFFMTLLSIIASTSLIFLSLALFDNSFKNNIPGVEVVRYISIALLFFSAILCALVIYNITNINISERTREIATLMVLGYNKKEVYGYIYREIYIMTAISALIGLPVGVGFSTFLFKYMGFGYIYMVNWWSYILTPIVTFLFAYISSLLLKYKINAVDMNDSLKTLE